MCCQHVLRFHPHTVYVSASFCIQEWELMIENLCVKLAVIILPCAVRIQFLHKSNGPKFPCVQAELYGMVLIDGAEIKTQ